MNSNNIFKATTLLLMLLFPIAIYLIFFNAPVDTGSGFAQKIFYFHVPIAWDSFLAFTIVFIASIAYLRTENKKYEIIAKASAEVGLVFTTLVLITGSIWGRTAWGDWWLWDVRLTTTLVLWLLYVGYLMLGSSVEEESKRARFLAVYGIVAFLDVPLVFFSVRLWNSIHPAVFASKEGSLASNMKLAFFFSLFTYTLFFASILWARIKLGNAQEQMIQIKEEQNV